MAISKERKDQIIKEFATHEGDTGSTQVQVAVLTADINNLTDHMRQGVFCFYSIIFTDCGKIFITIMNDIKFLSLRIVIDKGFKTKY